LKKCSKCGIEKDESEFHKKKAAKDGLTSICKSCAKEMGKLYRKDNFIEIKEKKKLYYEENKLQILEDKSKYYEENSEEIKKKRKLYAENNKEKSLKCAAKYVAKRNLIDPLFKLTKNIRSLI